MHSHIREFVYPEDSQDKNETQLDCFNFLLLFYDLEALLHHVNEPFIVFQIAP